MIDRHVLAGNPIEPYTWRAIYRDGSELRQFDLGGTRHTSLEIDRARIAGLMIDGHPDSPLWVPVPHEDRAPEEVIVIAEVSTSVTIGLANGSPSVGRSVRCLFGFRYAGEEWLVQIDAAGRFRPVAPWTR
jgi:hypothetical protein